MLRLVASAALGVVIGALIVALLGNPDTGMPIFGIALTVFILAITITRLASGLSASFPSAAAVHEARDARRLGRARIDSVRQTGTFINEQPVCDIDVTVVALTGDAWATTIRTIVPLIELPAYQSGVERDVAILLEGGPEVAFVDGELSPAEIERLVIPTRTEVEVRSIPPGTRIDKGRRRGPLIGIGRRGRPLRLAVFAVVAALAAGAVLLPFREGLGLTVDAWSEGRWSVDMRRPDTLLSAERSLEEAIGHDRVVSITVIADAVIVNAPVRAGAIETDEWTYRGGRVSHDGPAGSQPQLAEEQFSWSDVALDRIWPAIENASAQSGLPTDGGSVFIHRTTDTDLDSPTFNRSVEAPEISFGLRDDYRDQSFRLDATGTDLRAMG